MLAGILRWSWPTILITAVAICGYMFDWPFAMLVSVLGVLLIGGLISTSINLRDNEIRSFSRRIRGLASYFERRFMNNSPLSIFALTSGLFEASDHRLREWARVCGASGQIFDTWCDNFLTRMEADAHTGHLVTYLRHNVSELWSMVCHYHEFVAQFHDIGKRAGIPDDTLDAYNEFVVEYNTFIREFQGFLSELRKKGYSEIEPPSLKMADELVSKDRAA